MPLTRWKYHSRESWRRGQSCLAEATFPFGTQRQGSQLLSPHCPFSEAQKGARIYVIFLSTTNRRFSFLQPFKGPYCILVSQISHITILYPDFSTLPLRSTSRFLNSPTSPFCIPVSQLSHFTILHPGFSTLPLRSASRFLNSPLHHSASRFLYSSTSFCMPVSQLSTSPFCIPVSLLFHFILHPGFSTHTSSFCLWFLNSHTSSFCLWFLNSPNSPFCILVSLLFPFTILHPGFSTLPIHHYASQFLTSPSSTFCIQVSQLSHFTVCFPAHKFLISPPLIARIRLYPLSPLHGSDCPHSLQYSPNLCTINFEPVTSTLKMETSYSSKTSISKPRRQHLKHDSSTSQICRS